jgi:1-acyl-sn-glycerol-3-phosphate acyltransferase
VQIVFEKTAEKSLNLMGWQIDNHWDLNIDQCVMIAAPHTSNWDALYARLALKALGVNVRITIKDSYMKFPFGPFVRAMGGIGINRRPKQDGEARQSMVELMADLFKHHPKLVMLVTPEGTRAKQEKWKTGFYHVAMQAGVPIALAYMDYAQKKTVWVKLFILQVIMKKIWLKSWIFTRKYMPNFLKNSVSIHAITNLTIQ